MKQINLKLTVKQIEDLDKLSRAMGNVSKSNLIRIAVAEYISKHYNMIQDWKLITFLKAKAEKQVSLKSF